MKQRRGGIRIKKIVLILRFQRLRLHVVYVQTNDQNINTESGIHLIIIKRINNIRLKRIDMKSPFFDFI